MKTRGIAPKLLHNHLQVLRALEWVRLDTREPADGAGGTGFGIELSRGPIGNEERLSGHMVPSGFFKTSAGNVVAVVYVSAHVGDAKLAGMHGCFAARHKVVRWFSNSAATASRVAAITGSPCQVVSSVDEDSA